MKVNQAFPQAIEDIKTCLKLLRQASIHQRITFFLIIVDFSCVRLSCSYGIWLLFPMAIKEMTPATNCLNFVYLIVWI